MTFLLSVGDLYSRVSFSIGELLGEKNIEVEKQVGEQQEKAQEWAFLDELPQQMLGYVLDAQTKEVGGRTQLFGYYNEQRKLSFCAMYDKNTKEYSVRRQMGLTEFCDIDFCMEKQEGFERLLRERMKASMEQMACFAEANVDSIVVKKGILEWGRELELPQQRNGFSLYIAPHEPIRVINGSYIVLDYSDFASESNLVFYYNMFRDDFFAEIRIQRLPEMTTLFDSATTKELSAKMAQHLDETLQYMRNKIEGMNR